MPHLTIFAFKVNHVVWYGKKEFEIKYVKGRIQITMLRVVKLWHFTEDTKNYE